MDTEITLDLNKPLFSYSRYEINDHAYGDDFIHRDGDGVNMQVFFDRATGEFVSKGVSISDFTNLVEGKSARDTNAWTRHSLDPKELLPDDISKVEINDGMMAFLKTYRFNVCNVVERGCESRAKSFCQFLRSMRRKKLQKDAQAPLMVKRRSGIECQCLG